MTSPGEEPVEIEAVLTGAVPAPKTRGACARQDPNVECAPPYCPICVIYTPADGMVKS